jgi:hypothetical protein
MNNNRQSASAHRGSTTSAHPFNWEKMAILYARTALGIGYPASPAGSACGEAETWDTETLWSSTCIL